MVYQKIENALVETTRHKNAYGTWCWYIYINGKSAGLDCLEKDDQNGDYRYTIWYHNDKRTYCKTFRFNNIPQAKKWFSENCYIGVCGDKSFGVRIMPESALRFKLANIISWTGKRYARLKVGAVQGDFTNKVYTMDLG